MLQPLAPGTSTPAQLPQRGHSEEGSAVHKDLQGQRAMGPSPVCTAVVPEPHPVTAAGTAGQQR